MKIDLGLSKNAIPRFVGVGVCMYTYICINFHDKIIVCAGSVDLKGKRNKDKSKKETKKLTIVW